MTWDRFRVGLALLWLSIAAVESLVLGGRPLSTASGAAAALRHAQDEHEAEVAKRLAIWACDDDGVPAPVHFSDADFINADDVSVRFAGPDAGALVGAELVHATATPVLEADECDALVAEAAEAMDRGMSSSFTYTRANNLGEVHVQDLPAFGPGWLRRKLRSHFYPMLSSRFGLDPGELTVYDALVVRYDAARNATRQPAHRDAALVTINVALSHEDDFTGGGTLFEPTGTVVTKRAHAHVPTGPAHRTGTNAWTRVRACVRVLSKGSQPPVPLGGWCR